MRWVMVAAALALAGCAPTVSGDANGGVVGAFAASGVAAQSAAMDHCARFGRRANGLRMVTPTGNTLAFDCN